MIRTQIQLHAQQMRWLKNQALKNDISMSQLIRDSIDFYRSHIEASGMLSSKKEKALRAVGIFATDQFEADS
jgi:hypothetical protein